MPKVNWFYDENGNAVEAAQKVNALMIDKKSLENPYMKYRAIPDIAEPKKMGGGKFIWHVILGQDEAGDQKNLPTTSSVTLDTSKNKAVERVLEIGKPIQYPKEDGKVIALNKWDIILMDGINFSISTTTGAVKSLIFAEIKKDREIIDGATPASAGVVAGKFRKKTLTGDTLTVIKGLKDVAADYADISTNNTNWAIASPTGGAGNYNDDYPATKYFHQNNYSLAKGEVDIHLHPADIAEFSNVNIEAGAGSALQFMQFRDGTLTHINGLPVIANRFAKKGTAEFWPSAIKVIATPPEEMLVTNIFQGTLDFYKIEGFRCEHYYKSMLLTPELVTVVDFTIARNAK